MATNEEIKQACEQDLFTYAQMMLPHRYFGEVHREMFNFFQNSLEKGFKNGEGDNAAALIPRDHQKSFCIAVAVSWVVTKYPWITCVYVSSNPTLAERQLVVIKNILKSEVHRELWPEMLNYQLNPRTKEYQHMPKGVWTKNEIAVDHPDRPETEKDPTVAATSAKSTNTGAHYKLCVFDDLVTNENYQSPADRAHIKEVYQSYASIMTTGSIKWMVGTRYGEDDLYAHLKDMEYTIYDDASGDEVDTQPVWRWFERTVENSPNKDGSGTYVWPRMKMEDGSWYGFNRTELGKKKAESFSLELFFSQYYNDPNAADVDKITNEHFMYLNPSALEQRQGRWFYGSKELKINCGMDLAFSEGNGNKKHKRDYTAICVTGWDAEGYLYVLDLERFQTDRAENYYNKLIALHHHWDFRECTVETNAGGAVVARFIQDEIRKEGLSLIINHQHKNQMSGSKEERNAQTLEPLYRSKSVYHVKKGYTKLLEEELRLSKPPHDDLKDALYIAMSTGKRMAKPKFTTTRSNASVVNASGRFLSRTRRRA